MDVITAIKTRRTIRKYTGAAVNDQQLRTVLEAGFCAPSAMNLRPWHFVVVKDKEKLAEIGAAGTYLKMVPSADVAIVICGDSISSPHEGMLVNDCSAAAENMLLAAHGLGLGAVWCGIHEDQLLEFFPNILSLPKHIKPIAVIVLGHPAEERPAPDRFDESKVHLESF